MECKIEPVEFSAFNRRFDLYLTPKRGLLHSKFVGRQIDADGNERPLPVDPDDHFEGHVHGTYCWLFNADVLHAYLKSG